MIQNVQSVLCSRKRRRAKCSMWNSTLPHSESALEDTSPLLPHLSCLCNTNVPHHHTQKQKTQGEQKRKTNARYNTKTHIMNQGNGLNMSPEVLNCAVRTRDRSVTLWVRRGAMSQWTELPAQKTAGEDRRQSSHLPFNPFGSLRPFSSLSESCLFWCFSLDSFFWVSFSWKRHVWDPKQGP